MKTSEQDTCVRVNRKENSMNWKTFFLGSMIVCVMLTAKQGTADTTVSEINNMIILDATGSMNVDHCVDDDGVWQHRFWCAKEDAKAGLVPASIGNRYYALYILSGRTSGIVNLDDDE